MRTAHTIRFALTPDNVRLAWTVSGEGPALVKAANWLTHLEFDQESPVWRHWAEFLSGHFRFYRFDERGNGLSDHMAEDLSADRWASDLEVVIAASKPARPFVLLGISQGAASAMSYAADYPEDVSHLIIYGGYTRGWWARGDPDERRRREAVVDLTELGWGKPDPVFRRLYTSMFLPAGTEEQLRWYDDLCARSTSPETAARLMRAQGRADFSGLPARVKVPTLVLHAREDAIVPISEGVDIASGIPGAEFVQLESQNHILLEDEPAWDRFRQAVLEFTGRSSTEEDELFQKLSQRERQILSGLTEGRTNKEIGAVLFISEKTVRNHITRIFEKLGVRTRSQAIVMARDGGFLPRGHSGR
jgi:pimeloyl-ACP methyl ester carboxylesterase/DNA-binding CsgD family transcriptional regulator